MSETNLIHNRRALGVIGIVTLLVVSIIVYAGTLYFSNQSKKAYDAADQVFEEEQTQTYILEENTGGDPNAVPGEASDPSPDEEVKPKFGQ